MFLNKIKYLMIICMSMVWGCQAVNTEHKLIVNPSRNKILENAQFCGTSKSSNVQVFFQEGLKCQADRIGHLINQIFVDIENSTGIQTSHECISIYMLHGYLNQSDLNTSTITWDANTGFGKILYAKTVNDSCESIIAHNIGFPYTFVHEIIEHASVYGNKHVNIRGDFIENGISGRKNLSYTRWFRDGISEYCTFLAYNSLIGNSGFDTSLISHCAMTNGLSRHPFSSLDKISSNIFTWSQFDNFKAPLSYDLPYKHETTIDYYNASLGLFLLIRDLWGEDKIHEIVQNIGNLGNVNGQAIIEVFNSALKTDLKQFVNDYNFPKIGLYLNPSLVESQDVYLLTNGLKVLFVEPESVSDRAGITKDDIIYKINTTSIYSNLDYELAVYKSMSNDSITVHLQREYIGNMTIELMLSE